MGKSVRDMRKAEAGEAGEASLLVRDLVKEFQGPGEQLTVLNGLNFTLPRGESVAILGASGCGKSTLLHILGTLDTPTSGEVWLEGREVGGLTSSERARVRNAEIGFVFQFHHFAAGVHHVGKRGHARHHSGPAPVQSHGPGAGSS